MVLVKLTRSGKASVVTLTPDSNWTALCCSFPHSQKGLTSHAPPMAGAGWMWHPKPWSRP